MSFEAIYPILKEATFCYRLGAELSVVPFAGDSQYIVRNSMPTRDEIPSYLKKINVGIFGVGIDLDVADNRRSEFILLAHTYLLETNVIHEGARAKEVAAALHEDNAMVATGRIAALGQHYGLWKVVPASEFLSPGIIQTLLTLDSGFFFTEVQSPQGSR